MMRASKLMALVFLLTGSIVGAQESGASRRKPLRPQIGRQGGVGRPVKPGASNEQRPLQAQVRQAFARVVRRELNLDVGQMEKLRGAEVKYEQQRRAIL